MKTWGDLVSEDQEKAGTKYLVHTLASVGLFGAVKFPALHTPARITARYQLHSCLSEAAAPPQQLNRYMTLPNQESVKKQEV